MTLTRTITIDGMTVEVRFKRIRRSYLRVRDSDGMVVVTAPVSMSIAEVQAFVRANAEWVRGRIIRRIRAHERQENQLNDGAVHYLWGAPVILAVTHTCSDTESDTKSDTVSDARQGIPEARSSVAFEQAEGTVHVRRSPKASARDHHTAMAKWLGTVLGEKVPPLLRVWEPAMGRHVVSWDTRLMKSRWGSFNPRTHHIRLNTSLVHFDPRYLEYVLVHEMVHFDVRGHGPQFQRRMDRHLPDWKDRRRTLQATADQLISLRPWKPDA